jgi:TPR repeat protein
VRLLEGRGIERNTDEAVKWLRAAEAQGNAQAAMKLKELKP